ncbi:MAG TPA: hypothetical protein VI670_12730 [Thermoanaerobaculia bacterium]|jgi:hypothetical protein
MTLHACLLGQAHTREHRRWSVPTNDSREWLRALGSGDVVSYQRAFADPASIAGYDLALVELTPATHSLPRFLKRRVPHVTCVGLVEGRVEYVVRSAGEMEGLFQFAQAADDPDLLGILVERTLPYYRLYARVPERVQWLGIPYPLDWTETLPRSAPGERIVIELASGLDSRNGVANVLILRELQRRYPSVEGRVYPASRRERSMLEAMGIRAELLQPRRWPDYYRLLRRDTFAILCMDDRRTWGRYALDAASARVPYVGSRLSHAGERAGVLTCDPFDTATAIEHLGRLIEERLQGRSDWYENVTARQYAVLHDYDDGAARRRMQRALAAAGCPEPASRLEEVTA